MNKKIKKIIFLVLSILVLANNIYATTFSQLALNLSNGLIATITKLSFGFAVIFLFWGIFNFVSNASDQSKREEGKKKIIFGVIAIFVMVSVWGIVKSITSTTKLDNSHLEIKFIK